MLRLSLQLFPSKKGMGSSRNGHNSRSRRLRLREDDGQYVLVGNVLVCQRGTRIHPGENIGRGSGDTPLTTANSIVRFERKGRGMKRVISVEAEELA